MIRFLCLIATEDRLWNMKRSLRNLRQSHPGLVEGYCYSVWDLSTHPEKVTQMLQQAENCDFGIVYFHGGAQTLPDFSGCRFILRGRMRHFLSNPIKSSLCASFKASSTNS